MHHSGRLPTRKSSLGFLHLLVIVLFVLFAGIQSMLLYFGIAYFSTTVFVYVSVLLLIAGIISAVEVIFKIKVSSNVALLLFSIWLSLFTGEFLLRFVFKKNLDYNERVGGHYTSFIAV
jgi:hypothetical protein